MPTFVDRDQTVGLLKRTWAAVDDLCAELSEAEFLSPTCLPGWTVKDQLSHMLGTEETLAGRPMPKADISHLTHLRNDIARANELWVEARRAQSGAEVLNEFRAITQGRSVALDSMSQADFDAPSWTPAGADETYGRFMRIRAYDCFMHEHDIRAALGRPDRDETDPLNSALDEVATGLGFIVGKKANMPQGSRILFNLTGAVSRSFRVEVASRAAVVESLSAPPTVTVDIPAMAFLRRTGGRELAAHDNLAEVHLDGDLTLGEQLLSNLAFTI
jgi:uncharacterized protein (TIGR03083 family)